MRKRSGLGLGLCLACLVVACSGDDAAPTVGDCVEVEVYPGYTTCVLTEPPSRADDSASAAARAARLAETLPPAVELAHPLVDSGCYAVHDQGVTGWCAIHTTTSELEVEACRAGAGTRVSQTHLRYALDGNRPFTATDVSEGVYIQDAAATAASIYLVGAATWPAITSGAAQDIADGLNASKPADLRCPAHDRAAAVYDVGAQDLDAIRTLVAQGHPVGLAVPMFQATGWIPGASGFPAGGTQIVLPSPAPPNYCKCACKPNEANCTACPTEAHCVIGYHAVMVTGYDDAAGALTFVNSWGTGWSAGGFATMTYDFARNYSLGGSAVTALAPPPPPCGDTCSDHGDDLDAFYAGLVDWECGKIAECCTPDERPPGFSIAGCIGEMTDAIAPVEQRMDDAITAGDLGYACDAAAPCLDQFRAMTCGEFAGLWADGLGTGPMTGACADLLTPTLTDGATCTVDTACTSGRCALPPGQTLGWCRPPPVAGEPCHDNGAFVACAEDLYCAGIDQLCAPRGADGAACDAGYECLSGYCTPAGACAAPIACDGT